MRSYSTSDLVAVRVSTSSCLTIVTQATGTTLAFEKKEYSYFTDVLYDTTTGIFVAPMRGLYDIKVNVFTDAIALTTSQRIVLNIVKNTTTIGSVRSLGTGGNINHQIFCGSTVYLTPLDQITINVTSNLLVATIPSSNANTWLTVTRIGEP